MLIKFHFKIKYSNEKNVLAGNPGFSILMLSQNRQEQRPVYSFPELRNPEILQCLEDLRIPITDADLSRPTPQVIQKLFEAFAEIFFGGLMSFSNTPAVAEILEYPELHVESIGLISFFRSM